MGAARAVEPRTPPLNALRRSLERYLRPRGASFAIQRIEDLSPGLGFSRVYRVVVDRTVRFDHRTESVILKIPDWGEESSVQPRDPLVRQRERFLIEEGLSKRLPRGLRMPPVLGIERHDTHTWIWMKDVSHWLDVPWGPTEARRAVRRCALLHRFYRSNQTDLQRLPWLGQEEYAAYAHHIATAHRNLDEATAHPVGFELFRPGEVERLHHALELFSWAVQELRCLPQTLIHGDFHIRNLGFDSTGSLVVIDWAHVGIAPLGCDVATFVSVYRLFGGNDGGKGRAFDDELMAVYTDEIKRIDGEEDRGADISRASALWHLTWGLHLRLGPGLTALLRGHIPDIKERKRAMLDIREGCNRALAFLEETDTG